MPSNLADKISLDDVKKVIEIFLKELKTLYTSINKMIKSSYNLINPLPLKL